MYALSTFLMISDSKVMSCVFWDQFDCNHESCKMVEILGFSFSVAVCLKVAVVLLILFTLTMVALFL